MSDTAEAFTLEVAFSKRDDDQHLVGGWAYVAKRDGATLVDTQGDQVDLDDLRAALHAFVEGPRTLGVMHRAGPDGTPVAVGKLVEAAVIGGDFLPPGVVTDREGLWLVAHVTDPAVWRDIKAGRLGGFSIGGKAIREPVDA